MNNENRKWKVLKSLVSLGFFIGTSILGFKQHEGFKVAKMRDKQSGVDIRKVDSYKIGVSEAFANCGMGMNCSGGGGQCGMGMNCGGEGGNGYGQCGMGMNCSGGGGQCGMGMNCSGN